MPQAQPNGLYLSSGSHVAVIGGGPAGSFFAYFMLESAERFGIDLDVEINEPRDFSCPGPQGCNMCGGIISESLVQFLATEGINLPTSVVQRGIGSYTLHTDVGSVRIETPLHTARRGAPYVKQYVEERDLTLLLVVDVSGSQPFGSQYLLKRDYAAELAAVLAFSAVANHDRVGAVLFSDRIEGYVPPARGRDHALRIVRDLLAREPLGRGTDLAGALRFAQRVLRRRGIVAVISDFRAEGYEKALGAVRRRHDVVALHLRDPREADVPAAGLVAFTDPETGERMVADTARPEVRRALRAPGFDAAQAVFKKTSVDALSLSTGELYDRRISLRA